MPNGSKNWCFTLNNYSEQEENDIKELMEDETKCTYGVYGREVGEEGTPHLQGFIQLVNRKTIAQVKVLMKTNRVHLEAMRGTALEAAEYCKKDGDFFEHGQKKEKGERSDLKAAIKMFQDRRNEDEMMEFFPSQWVMYGDKIRKSVQRLDELKAKKDWNNQFTEAELRPWQRACVELLDRQNKRQIMWVFDEQGNSGKTWLSHYLVATQDAQVIPNMKKNDFAYLWEGKRITIFDFERSVGDGINYHNLEMAKNGFVVSGKYEGKKTYCADSKVLVFANQRPDETKLSADRWFIVNLNNDIFAVEID